MKTSIEITTLLEVIGSTDKPFLSVSYKAELADGLSFTGTTALYIGTDVERIVLTPDEYASSMWALAEKDGTVIRQTDVSLHIFHKGDFILKTWPWEEIVVYTVKRSPII